MQRWSEVIHWSHTSIFSPAQLIAYGVTSPLIKIIIIYVFFRLAYNISIWEPLTKLKKKKNLHNVSKPKIDQSIRICLYLTPVEMHCGKK